MRRTSFLGTAVLAVMLLGGGVALAHEVIRGTPGEDTLTGDKHRNTIYGLGGADSISGLTAADDLRGGSGDDRLRGGEGRDTLRGGTGNFGAETNHLYGGDGADTFYGSGRAPDTTQDETGPFDRMYGGTGADRFFARHSFVVVRGAFGEDRMRGGEAGARLEGGRGSDSLTATGGCIGELDPTDCAYLSGPVNYLLGGAGGDDLHADPDPIYNGDRLEGGTGWDQLEGGSGLDEMVGGDGRDEIRGGDERDPRDGDTIHADDGHKDTVDCGGGNDTAYVDAGLDVVSGCESINPPR